MVHTPIDHRSDVACGSSHILNILMSLPWLKRVGLLIFCGKKSKISRDFQGQIRGKIGRFRGKKVKIRGTIGRFRAIFAGEKSKFAEKSAHFAGF